MLDDKHQYSSCKLMERFIKFLLQTALRVHLNFG